MGIGFFFWRWDLFFARKRGKKRLGCFSRFGVVFLRFLVVISRFWGCFRAMRPLLRAQREFFFGFFFRGAVSKTRNFRSAWLEWELVL